MKVGIFNSYNHAGNARSDTGIHPAFTSVDPKDPKGLHLNILAQLNVMTSGFVNQNDYTPSQSLTR